MRRMGAMLRWRTAAFFLAALVEQLMLLPIWLIIDTYLVPDGTRGLWFAGLPLLSFTGIAFSLRQPALWKQVLIAIAAGGLFAYVAAGSAWQALPLLVVGIFTVLLGTSVQNRMWELRFYWLGIAGYFAFAILFANLPALEGWLPLLTVSGCLCIAIALFLTNHVILQGASLSRGGNQRVPSTLRRHNRIYVGAMIGGVILITAVIGNFIGLWLLNALRSMFRWLLSRPAPEAEPIAQPEAQPMQPMIPDAGGEPGLLSKILDILFYTVTIAMLAAAVGYLFYWLYRNAGGIWRQWIDRLIALLRRTNRVEEGAGYVDEESGVFNWDVVKLKMRDSIFGRFFQGRSEDRWENMRDNRERVRYLYRRWLRSYIDHGYKPQRALTPAETAAEITAWRASTSAEKASKSRFSGRNLGDTAAEPLVELYNKARYSSKDITDDELEKIRKG